MNLNKLNPLNLLVKIFPKSATVPIDLLKQATGLDAEELKQLKNIGITSQMAARSLSESLQINFERSSLYKELDRAVQHWMV